MQARIPGVVPLNPVEVEVIHLFVQFSRALNHPCKIYNILAVRAPVIYIGPQPSHVSEILDRLGDEHPWAAAAHGEVEMLVRRIRELRARKTGGSPQIPVQVAATFAKGTLLPQLIAVLENAAANTARRTL